MGVEQGVRLWDLHAEAVSPMVPLALTAPTAPTTPRDVGRAGS